MSIEHLNAALNLEMTSPADKAVLIGLANHADPKTGWAFPSIATLMRYGALGERTVQDALKRLSDSQLITIYRIPGRMNCYRLLIIPVDMKARPPRGSTPARTAPPPPREPHPTPAGAAPEPLMNHQLEPSHKRDERKSGLDAPADSVLPDGWWPTDDEICRAKKDFPNVNITLETLRFIDTNMRDGTIVLFPVPAWRAWLGRSAQFKERDAARTSATSDRGGDSIRAVAYRLRQAQGS